MIQLLTLAERALGRLDGASGILPNVDLFVAMYVNKEAVLSSQIEGTQASLIDVLAFEADAAVSENPQDIEEVVNYISALNFGLQRFEDHRNIIAAYMPRSAGPAYQLLEYLYTRPIVTVNGVVKVTGLSYANANRLINTFQTYHLLQQMDTYQRNRRFAYSTYLSLFTEERVIV